MIRIENPSSGSAPADTFYILMEDGGHLLLEDGGKFLLDEISPFGVIDSVTLITTTYGVSLTDEVIVCNSSTPFTVTLPTPVLGQLFRIKNIGSGTITVACSGGVTIDGVSTKTVLQDDSNDFQCVTFTRWGRV